MACSGSEIFAARQTNRRKTKWRIPMSWKPIVLCVDETPSFLEGYKMLLEENGYRVLTATDGKEALEVFMSRSIDLVLLDYHMPEMNGAAAALHMKELKADVPILLLSSDKQLPLDDLEAVDCFLPKSESVDDLLEKVDYLLSLRLLFQPLETLKRRSQKAA
jgi:CheY-like chemotaxis protein